MTRCASIKKPADAGFFVFLQLLLQYLAPRVFLARIRNSRNRGSRSNNSRAIRRTVKYPG